MPELPDCLRGAGELRIMKSHFDLLSNAFGSRTPRRGKIIVFRAGHMRSERISIYGFLVALLCLAMVQYCGMAWAFHQSKPVADHYAPVNNHAKSPNLCLTDLSLVDDPDDLDDDEDLPVSITPLILADYLISSAFGAQIAAYCLNSTENQILLSSRTLPLLI